MKQKGFVGILVVIIFVVILIGAVLFYFFNPYKQIIPVLDKTQKITEVKNGVVEVAKRTIYQNGQSSEVIEERSTKYQDGSLETLIRSGGQELSHHLFVKNNVFNLSAGVLSVERANVQKVASSYLTNGENLLKFVKQNPNLPKTSTTLNGQKLAVYTINGAKPVSFGLIKSVFAEGSDGDEVKVYVDESAGKIKKVEQLLPNSQQPAEVIDYSQESSLLNNSNSASASAAQASPPVSPVINNQLNQIVDQINSGSPNPEAVIAINKLQQAATSVKVVSVDPGLVPDDAIYLNPLSTIPTPTAYNSPIMVLTSKLFHQAGLYTSADFVSKNIKARIDGVEVNNSEISWNQGLNDQPGSISFLIPKGLTPGFHTVEAFMINSWYLAPNLLVTLPGGNDKVLELQLFVNPPPFGSRLPNGDGYRVVLKGTNFIKPLQVSLDNTILDDSAVSVNGTDELVLTIPANIPRPVGLAYDVTIIKDGQKAFRPSFLILGGSTPPNP